MNELKRGWKRIKFGDVVRQVKDKVEAKSCGLTRYIAGAHMDTDDLAIRRWGEITDDYLGPAFHMRFKPGHVLYGSRRTYLRKVAVADFEGITANTTFVLESKDPSILLPELLPFIMSTEAFHAHSKKQSKGSVNPYVNFSDLIWYEFALPPLEEQCRIAALLNATQAAVNGLAEVSDTARSVYRALLKAHFLDDLHAANTKIGLIGRVRNGTTPRRNRSEYWGGNVPWIPTGKVNERRIVEADEFITSQALSECSLDLIPAGSSLVAMVGQGKTRGKTALLQFDATINQNFAAVIPSDAVHPLFMFYQLEAKYELFRAWSQGTNQLALNCGLISDFPFWAPELLQQKEIVERLQTAESAYECAMRRLNETRHMLRKTHQKVLAGGLA